MNPLTQIKNTQKITRAEHAAGVGDSASWHARFKHSAYIFAGGLPYELTEGDVLAVFAQYGEVVDVNLIRDRQTNKSRGFCFLAYEDQRSTVLAVDNLSGARVGGRIIQVTHVDNYKRRKAEITGEQESESEEESEEEEASGEEPERTAGHSGGAFGSIQELMAEAAKLKQAGQLRSMGDMARGGEGAQQREKKDKKDKKKSKKDKKDKKDKKERARQRSPSPQRRSRSSPRRRSRSPSRRQSRSPPRR